MYIQHMAHIIFEKQVHLILKFDLSGLVMSTNIMLILSSPHTLSHMHKLRMYYTIPEHSNDSPIYKYVVPFLKPSSKIFLLTVPRRYFFCGSFVLCSFVFLSWSTSELRVRLAQSETGLRPLVKYFTNRSKAVLLLWIIYVISVLFLLCFRARLFIYALWSPAGKGLTSWLLFVMSNCEVVTFPLVSWVRCGAWLHRFLIFAIFLLLLRHFW